jgi:TPR repeat protein
MNSDPTNGLHHQTGYPILSEEAGMHRKSRSYRGMLLKRLGLSVSAAVLLHAGACYAQAQTQAPEPETTAAALLREAPKPSAAASCNAAQPALPLATDWQAWQGNATEVAADRMLSDAIRLAEGDGTVNRDRKLARKMLEHLATGASNVAPDAKVRLATLLLDPKSGPPDAERAKRLLAEATASQRTGAALAMGKLIREQRLPGSTMTEATRYLSIAAGLGDPAAALQLSAIYSHPDPDQTFPGGATHFATLAAINIQTALAAGDCAIAVDVGEYLLDIDPEGGKSAAAAWFDFAAASGDPRGIARLARVYETGEGRSKDVVKATELWDRAAAAGLVRALLPAARLRLADGKELETASRLLDKAVANEEAEGYVLAARLHRGDYTGRADFAAMQAVLGEAAKQPDAPVSAIDMLANAYLTGQGVEIDKEKADSLYHLVLDRGGPEGEAIYARYMIDNGLGLAEASRHLQSAAANGSQSAPVELAEIALCNGLADGEAMMRQAADRGSATALRRLARFSIDRGDWASAAQFLQRAVELGDRPSMVELAALAAEGRTDGGVDKARLVQRAAAIGPGVIDGRLALALAYRAGRFGDMTAESERLFQGLADSHRPDVDVELVRQQTGGTGQPDMADIKSRLVAAASAGEPKAMLMLSRLSASTPGEGESARNWLTLAAQAGDAEALAQLPTDDPNHLDGILAALKQRLVCDVPALVQEARIYRLRGDGQAAGDVMAKAERVADRRPRDLHVLAEAYAAQGVGAANDPAKAAALFERAATAGYVKSALSLANLYATGRLGDHSEQSIDWYKQAAIGGQSPAVKELVRYASGQPGQKTSDMALAALRQVAEHGDASVMQAYGALLATFGPERYAEGMTFLERAAAQGDIQAMKTLARLYAAGINGQISASESTQWTRLAAEKGDPEAMFQYAVALDLGFGTTPDRQLAQSWHEKAKKNGFVR